MLLAQTTPTFDPISLLQLGIAGAVLAALMLGWLWAKPAVEQIVKQRDELATKLTVCEQETVKAVRDLEQAVRALSARVEELTRTRRDAS
jgi:hypothetical protein